MVAGRLQNLLDLLPGGVIVLDQHGVVSHCNPAAIGLLGEPLLGEVWLRVITRCFSPRSDDGHEISLKDGRRISIATRSLDVEPGQIILLTDQTETRQLQQRLSRHERLSAMGRMMSSLAHQIRTPLSAAMLYAGHLNESELTKAQVQKFSQKILSRLNHLEQQVNDMLIFVKGDVKLTDTLPVEHLLKDLESAMEVPLRASQSQCSVINLAPGTLLHCNLQTMVGALLNIVNNAIQACGKNAEIVVRVSLVDDGARVSIAIEDNGPGMSSEVISQVQEAFFTTKSHGTGLGLAVARAIAKAHHGEFFIRSQPGEGTEAGICLPVHCVTAGVRANCMADSEARQ
jgi:two-component system sensor histidine kinase FlrB